MSLLQTVTQVQDQAISFVPKLIVVGLVVFAMMPWMADYYVQYAQDALTQIPSLVFGG
jgi:flagellar biosynthetic protein FliQ